MTLYKYVVPERIDILKNGLIRFTQPMGLNDQFDLRPLFDSFMSKDDVMTWQIRPENLEYLIHDALDGYPHLPAEVQKKVRPEELATYIRARLETDEGREEIWQLIESSWEYTVAPTEAIKAQFLGVFNGGGILSMSEVADDLDMWTAYAGDHRGFVICFNGKHAFFGGRFRQGLFRVDQVRYADRAPYPSIFKVPEEELFFTKRARWAYEREWRMIAGVSLADRVITGHHEPIYLFAIPSDCIEGLIMGASASDQLIAEVRALKRDDPRYGNLSLRRARIGAQKADFEDVS